MTGTWRDTLFVWDGRLTTTTTTTRGHSRLSRPRRRNSARNSHKGDRNDTPRIDPSHHDTTTDATTAVRRDDDDGNNSSSSTTGSVVYYHHWTGRWVGCDTGNPDARTAPTPNATAVAASDMAFDVSSTTEKTREEDGTIVVVDLSGGSGWDLADGGGGGGDDAGKSRYMDHTHVVCWRTNNSIRTDSDDDKYDDDHRQIAVAVGKNDFGPFVSAGYIVLCKHSATQLQQHHRLTLARRYLDSRDARAKWTVQDLYHRIVGNHDHQTNNDEACILIHQVAPWRTLDLHAKTRMSRAVAATKKNSRRNIKRQRVGDDEDDSSSPFPSLIFPTSSSSVSSFTPVPPFHNTLTIVSEVVGDEEEQEKEEDLVSGRSTVPQQPIIIKLLVSTVRWLEQCHGCGAVIEAKQDHEKEEVDHTVAKSSSSRPVCFSLWTVVVAKDPSKPRQRQLVDRIYCCSRTCAVTKGLSLWIDAGDRWKRRQTNDNKKFAGPCETTETRTATAAVTRLQLSASSGFWANEDDGSSAVLRQGSTSSCEARERMDHSVWVRVGNDYQLEHNNNSVE